MKMIEIMDSSKQFWPEIACQKEGGGVRLLDTRKKQNRESENFKENFYAK